MPILSSERHILHDFVPNHRLQVLAMNVSKLQVFCKEG